MQEKSERAQREEKVLQFWKENKIFEKSLEKPSPKGDFVFYDGPPFATGLPHYGSLLSSIIKDVIPRYKTMRGFHVRRRWGWDCHGLPIENMVEKELGLKNKKEIEEIGVARFNRACRDSVLRFADEWKKFVDRIGRFVDYDNSYMTMDNSYMESVWWFLREIYNKGLLYEGRKVLLYCPHCETPLSKAEIAMDNSYKDVTEEAVTVKFKMRNPEKIGIYGDAYLLAWTTTPWTLPGNVALAIGEGVEYVHWSDKKENTLTETYIMASKRFNEYEIEAVTTPISAGELIGLEYEPLFDIPKVADQKKTKAFTVLPAGFVTTEEGTGIVHTAVIYGEDDYNLGLKEDLPMVQLLDQSGNFNNDAPELIRGQYFKKAQKVVIDELRSKKLLFGDPQKYTHSYPHCHRCGTALIYNALVSWFINIQKVKDQMLVTNEEINWVPSHLKHGRYKNIVENAPDWTISRNRYWASPLPIWKDAEGNVRVIGSLEELKKRTKKSGNKYFVMRHGEAQSNASHMMDPQGDPNNHLTQKGKEEVIVSAKNLGNIDLIFASPFLRTKETAEIVRQELRLPESAVVIDERLHEFNDSDMTQVEKRMGDFVFEVERSHKQKNILIISHGNPLWVLEHLGMEKTRSDFTANEMLATAEIRELSFVPFPHNEDYQLDLHRPYIDEIKLISEDGRDLKRIPEVIDGWVESGSMPFAEYHYPFENQNEFRAHFPGDFIAEYIAQTRTWFYYMHAVAALLFGSISFRNVVTTGTILAEDGSKMSKSKGNYTDPMMNLDRFGADAIRYYLMSSVVMQAEDVRFVDDEVRQIHNQVINILWNSFKFYEFYADEEISADFNQSQNVLDKWILARLREIREIITFGLDTYNTVKATRPIKDFISDFSTWYIRRSRERFKSEDAKDRAFAMATTRHVLMELSKLIAPTMPFLAEDIYRELRTNNMPDSVHLCDWPVAPQGFSSWSSTWFPAWFPGDKIILENMNEVRKLVSLALEARSKADTKVRQPLSKLEVRSLKFEVEYQDIIKGEINVKEIIENSNLNEDIRLDTNLTPELIEEGRVRDAIRLVQEWRKEKGLKPGEKMKYIPPAGEEDFFKKHSAEIEKATNVELAN